VEIGDAAASSVMRAEVPAEAIVSARQPDIEIAQDLVLRGRVSDRQDAGIAGATIRASVGSSVSESESGTDGRYEFVLADGGNPARLRLYISVEAPGYCPRADFFATPRKQPSGDRVVVQDFELGAGHALRGRVFAHGVPVAGAVVNARSTMDQDTTHRVAWCDATGAFLLGVPHEDRLSSSRQIELCANHGLHGSATRIVDNAANDGSIDLELEPCSDVVIDLVDRAGNGLSGLEVEVHVVGTHLLTATRGASLCVTRTDAGGELHFLGLAAGEVELKLPQALDVEPVPRRFVPAKGVPRRVTVNGSSVCITTLPELDDVMLRWWRVGRDGNATLVRGRSTRAGIEWLLPPGSIWRIDAKGETQVGTVTFDVPDTSSRCRFVIPLEPR